jgi:hypothetical protein
MRVCRSAPRASKVSTIAASPRRAAMCNGVSPLYEPAAAEAPASSNAAKTAAFFCRMAASSGVSWLSLSVKSNGSPGWIRRSAAAVSPP